MQSHIYWHNTRAQCCHSHITRMHTQYTHACMCRHSQYADTTYAHVSSACTLINACIESPPHTLAYMNIQYANSHMSTHKKYAVCKPHALSHTWMHTHNVNMPHTHTHVCKHTIYHYTHTWIENTCTHMKLWASLSKPHLSPDLDLDLQQWRPSLNHWRFWGLSP